MKLVTTYLSLGSNLGEREAILEAAVAAIAERVGRVSQCSSIYETEAVGYESEHLFLNMVVEVETTLEPLALMKVTQEIEQQLGRTQKSNQQGGYQDRSCDIDIILYGNEVVKELGLEIPHPRFRERLFVLEPLCEIAPGVVDPVTHKTVEELLHG